MTENPQNDHRENKGLPSDFGEMDKISPADLEREVRSVLSGDKRLSEVSPLVKGILQRMRSKQ